MRTPPFVVAFLVAWIPALMAAAPAVAQDMVLEVIQLRYRTVEQVLPVIQPLVPRPGTVSGMQSNLIVRTTPANLADIRRVLDSIDRVPRKLMITVRHDADGIRSEDGAQVSGRIGTGDARVIVPGSGDDRGLVVEGRRADDRVRAQAYGTQSLDNDRISQQVQVLEGNEAFIRVGQSVPVPQRSIVRRMVNGRVIEQSVETTDYRDIASGFRVRARLSGDVVTLDVSPQRDTPGGAGVGSMDIQHAGTTVSGRLGEWIDLGGVVSGQSFQSSGTAYRTQSAAAVNRRILVRVDEIR